MFYKKNRVKCLTCDEVLVSSDDTWVECSCGDTKISGGRSFLGRQGKNFKEMSIIEIPEEIQKTINEEYDPRPTPPLGLYE